MPDWIISYVRITDKVNRKVGRVAMYLVFVMMAILLYSSITKTVATPALWTLEMAQFSMVAYYILGGPYSMQMGDHVRMDLAYGAWSTRTKAWVDAFTVLFLITYLIVLLYGGFESTLYAIKTGERSYSAWRPYMWPIKVIMSFGIFLMILQAISAFFKDVATIKGVDLQ